jgi:hypothetical protein
MAETKRSYPDISDILARKAAGRRELAGLTFGQKVARIEALRERLAPLKRLRQERRTEDGNGTKIHSRKSGVE